MAAVALDQYLASVLKSNSTDKNEIKLEAGNPDFDLFTIYLENHNTGIHRYRMDVSTILYIAKGTVTIKSGEKIIQMKSGNVLLLTEGCKYEILSQKPDTVLIKLKFKRGFLYRKYFKDFSCKGEREVKVIEQIVDSLENEHVLWLKNNQITRASQVMQHIIGGYLNNDLFTKALIQAELTTMLIISIRTQRMATPTSLDKTKFEKKTLDNYIDLHFPMSLYLTLQNTLASILIISLIWLRLRLARVLWITWMIEECKKRVNCWLSLIFHLERLLVESDIRVSLSFIRNLINTTT